MGTLMGEKHWGGGGSQRGWLSYRCPPPPVSPPADLAIQWDKGCWDAGVSGGDSCSPWLPAVWGG